MSPDINHMLHLSVFPDDEFRKTTIFLVCMSIAGTFLWDRLVLFLFGPPPVMPVPALPACAHTRARAAAAVTQKTECYTAPGLHCSQPTTFSWPCGGRP